MSEEQKEYIKNNEFNIQFGGRGIAKQKYAKLQQENEYYKNILTEFEKWLEEKINRLEKMNIDILNPIYSDIVYSKIELKRCLDKLQELKGENNEKI